MTGESADSLTPSGVSWARWDGTRLRLLIHAQPGARATRVTGVHGERLRIALKAPPVDGKANGELVRFVSQALGLRRAQVELAAGASSREKMLHIECDRAAALAHIKALAPAG